jgi:pyruvate dehydrogenase E2 component (dihydrolipoamide acetyltransferase)
MPSLGADMEYGTLVQWHVKPGDAVRRGDVVALVETQKGLFEVEIFEDGVIDQLLIEANSRVPVGAVLARVRSGAAVVETGVPARVSRARASPAARKRAAELGVDLARVRGTGPDGAITLSDIEQATTAPSPAAHPQRVSPVARRMAEELHLDIAAIAGTGTGGAVTKADVERAAAAHGAVAVVAPAVVAPTNADRIAAMRQAIAAAVSRSKREIPHYYLAKDISLDAALHWLQTANLARPVAQRMLPAVLLLKALALALRKFTEFNGAWVDNAFHPSEGIHIGVAVSLRGGGLIAPCVRDSDRKSLDELMHDLNDVVQRARTGGLRISELTESTVTVSNLGDQGADSVFGVIYPPQVALIGFGRISERPWADNDMLGVRPVVTATLAADHRASDGARGSMLLAEIARLLQTPEKL